MPPFGYNEHIEAEEEQLDERDVVVNPELIAAREAMLKWDKGEIDKLCITGGPGTGKTTLTRAYDGKEGVQILAPTNLAAGLYQGGMTMHMYLTKKDQCFMWTDDLQRPLFSGSTITHVKCACQEHAVGKCDPLECKVNVCKCSTCSPAILAHRFTGLKPLTLEHVEDDIVLDEFSMVDREVIKTARRIIIVGDLNQLSPINGSPMTKTDLMEGGWTVVELKHNYRAQTQEVREIHALALTDPIGALNNCPTRTVKECAQEKIPILTWRNAVSNAIHDEKYPKLMMLTRRSELGVTGMIVKQVEPSHRTVDDLGVITDIVPLTRGREGKIRYISNLSKLLRNEKINRGELRSYMKDSTPMIEAAAFTTHKAQGQTFDRVGVHEQDMVAFSHSPYYSAKLPYTAITRGRLVFKVIK